MPQLRNRHFGSNGNRGIIQSHLLRDKAGEKFGDAGNGKSFCLESHGETRGLLGNRCERNDCGQKLKLLTPEGTDPDSFAWEQLEKMKFTRVKQRMEGKDSSGRGPSTADIMNQFGKRARDAKPDICWQFARDGHCRFGNKCNYSHDT